MVRKKFALLILFLIFIIVIILGVFFRNIKISETIQLPVANRGIEFDSANNYYVYAQSNSIVFLSKFNMAGGKIWERYWTINNSHTLAVSAKIDFNDNIYVIAPLLDIRGTDVALIKYNSEGNLQWSVTWGGTQEDYPTDIFVDNLGNIYVTGYTFSYGSGDKDSFLLKYNSSGFLIWEKFWGTPGSDVSNGIGIDLNGSIYLGGSTETSGDRDVFLLKYDNNGNITWVKTWSEKPLEECDSLIIDDENFIYLGGIQNISNTNSQILLLKYDFKGNLLWNLTWGGLEYETCLGMTLDPFNNIILCGETGSFGAKNGDSFYVRFNSLGNLIDFYRVGDDNSEAFYDVKANFIEDTYTIFLVGALFGNNGTVHFVKFYDLTIIYFIINIINFSAILIISAFILRDYVSLFKIRFEQKRVEKLRIHLKSLKSNNISAEKVSELINNIRIKKAELIVLLLEEVIKERGMQDDIISNERENIASPAISKNLMKDIKEFERITEQFYNNLTDRGRIRYSIFKMSWRYERVAIPEIAEYCGVKNEKLIIKEIKKMIRNKEISAQYFKNTNIVMFDQGAIIKDIENLLDNFEKWESIKKYGKKDGKKTEKRKKKFKSNHG